MTSKITPVKVIQFTKISVALTCAWPPSPKTTKFGIILFKTWWYTCYFSNILLLLPLLSSIYEYLKNPVILAKSVCLSCAVLQATIKMMICRIQAKIPHRHRDRTPGDHQRVSRVSDPAADKVRYRDPVASAIQTLSTNSALVLATHSQRNAAADLAQLQTASRTPKMLHPEGPEYGEYFRRIGSSRTIYSSLTLKLYYKMETFCKEADDKTNITLQHYVDNHKHVYGIYALWCYLTAIGVICGPVFLPQQFPTDAKYPFFIEQHPIKSIIYLHQSLVGLQAAAGMCIDCNIALLLFYSAARLQLLAQKIRDIRNELCAYWADKQSEKLGGPGHTVEIDEAKIGHRKYNRGRLVKGNWIFGGYERESKKVFIMPVEDRSEKTLLACIKQWIMPGTTIISDCWKSYDCLNSEGFQHLNVNHTYNFVDPDTVCAYWADKQSEKLGGPGHTVEIDEAKIGHRKYNRGRLVKGNWIFGGYERESKKVFIMPVEDRSEKTLLACIKQWIMPGTTIISDCWKSYDCLNSEGFQHLNVNHTYNFVDPDTVFFYLQAPIHSILSVFGEKFARISQDMERESLILRDICANFYTNALMLSVSE
nr:PREDICTED: uncharacterized protein LOC105678086 [Linepithema humile]